MEVTTELKVAETVQPTPEEILQAEIEAKAAALATKHGVPVHPILFYDMQGDKEQKDPIIGYVKEPSLEVKIRVLDKGQQLGEFAASYEMLELCLDKESSDPRIWDKKPANHKYTLGACLQAQRIIEISLSFFKKK